jgi:hypothetical protein
MQYNSGSDKSRSGGGCLKGCGCFTGGFLCGMLAIPLILYLLMSWPWFQRQVDRVIDTRQISRQLEKITREINAAADRADIPVLPEIAAEPETFGGGGAMSEFNRTFTHDNLEIFYRCTERSDTDRPFIHGSVTNHRSEPLRYLSMESIFRSGEGQEFREELEIIKDGSPNTLSPGDTKRFVLHPRSVPADWDTERMEIRVKAAR